MATANVLSANVLKQITGISAKQYKKVAWHTAELVVRQFLDVQETMALIDRIVHGAMDPDGAIVVGLIDFSARIGIVSAYALVELPQNADELYYVLYASDLYDTVLKYVNKNQVEAVISAVYKYIELCDNIRL